MASSSTAIDMRDVDEALARAVEKMNYSMLRPNQEKVVKEFMGGRDVFVSLPTGSGKSLCYCVLPMAFDEVRSKTLRNSNVDSKSIVVVVSPLIALMKDQVRAMKDRNVKAVYAGDMDDQTEQDVCNGKYQLIFISPESLMSSVLWHDVLLSPVYQANLVGLIVDEAHCVKKWGSTFRRDYLELGTMRSLIPDTVWIMALTATATEVTRCAVCRILGLISPAIISEVPNKPNIKYIVQSQCKSLEETFAPLVEEIRHKRKTMDRVIIYCRTYDSCSMIYLFLKSRLKGEIREPIGIKDLAMFRLVDMFTACTRPPVKEAILESFCKPYGTLRVVVATVAFGMGLDCPDVRNVIHWGPSSDLEQRQEELVEMDYLHLPNSTP